MIQMPSPIRFVAPTLCLLAAAPQLALAGEYTVTQKDKTFSVRSLKVKVGDEVRFVNEDPFSHNIFSLSNAKSFDLGTYPKGQSKSVTFDKAGIVEVECAVHPDMKMVIEVEK
jgi:plastocyanin